MVKSLSAALVSVLVLASSLAAQQVDIVREAPPKYPKAEAVAPAKPKRKPADTESDRGRSSEEGARKIGSCDRKRAGRW